MSGNTNRYLKIFWIVTLIPLFLIVMLIFSATQGWLGKMPSFEELENPKSNLATEIYSSDQVVIGKYYYQNRSNTSFAQLSPNLVNALKATEDIRFEQHSGIDIRGLFRVLFKTVFLGQQSSGGGSTLTQQLAKNLFPRDPKAGKFKTALTKVREWVTAVRLERNYTKEEILAMYLNTVEFGSNAFGIKSAARTFFNKAPDSLKVEEAAVLVGLLKAPTYYSPVRNIDNATMRRNTVMAQMKKYDLLSEAEYDSLSKLPIKVTFQPEDHNFGIGTYFREHLRLELQKWCNEHAKADGTPYNLYRDGLRIYTTIDSRMQRYAEEAMTQHLSVLQDKFFEHWKGRKTAPFFNMSEKETNDLLVSAMKRSDRYRALKGQGKNDREILSNFKQKTQMRVFSWRGDVDTVMSPWDSIRYYKHFLQSGFMSMEPQTGFVRAWVGGINHQYFKYDHVREGRRQVGSSFKPFVYALAMQEGYSPCLKVPNNPVTFENVDGLGNNWTPENAETDFDGRMMTLKEALAESVNRITAFLMKQFGPQAVIDVARKLGVTSPIPAVPSICLGTPDISVYEMVGAYAAFANKGVWTEPIYLTRIEDNKGNVLQEFVPKRVDALNEETAYLMLNLLEGVVQYGTSASLRGSRFKLYQPMAGKTGTTQEHSDGWYIGITPDLVSGCWVGNEDRSAHFRSMEYGQGARMALPIWAYYMQRVYADKTIHISQGPFEKPKQKLSVEINCKEAGNQNPVDPFQEDGF